jgi:hypothetical protein
MMYPDNASGHQQRRERQCSDLDLPEQHDQPGRNLKRSSTMPELGQTPGLMIQPPTPLDLALGKQTGHWRAQAPQDQTQLYVGSHRSTASSNAGRSGSESFQNEDDFEGTSPGASCDFSSSPQSSHVRLRGSQSPTPSSTMSAPTSRCSSKAKGKASVDDDGQPKRPLNSFMLYRKDKWPAVPNKNHQSISRIIGEMWRNESPETKQRYDQLAKKAKEQHQALYPGYKFHPKKKKEKEGKSGVRLGAKYRQSGSVGNSGIPSASYSQEDYLRHIQPPMPYGYYPLQPDRTLYEHPGAGSMPLFPTAREARASLAQQQQHHLQQRQQQAQAPFAAPYGSAAHPYATPATSSSDEQPRWSVPTAEAALRQHRMQMQLRKQQQDEARAQANADAQAQQQAQNAAWMQALQAQLAHEAAVLEQQMHMMPSQDVSFEQTHTDLYAPLDPAEIEPFDLLSTEYGVPAFVDEFGQTHAMAGLMDLAIYDPSYDGGSAFGPAAGQWAATDMYEGISGEFSLPEAQ